MLFPDAPTAEMSRNVGCSTSKKPSAFVNDGSMYLRVILALTWKDGDAFSILNFDFLEEMMERRSWKFISAIPRKQRTACRLSHHWIAIIFLPAGGDHLGGVLEAFSGLDFETWECSKASAHTYYSSQVGIAEVICQGSPNRSRLLPNDGPPFRNPVREGLPTIQESWGQRLEPKHK
jgi:hypothetical protein